MNAARRPDEAAQLRHSCAFAGAASTAARVSGSTYTAAACRAMTRRPAPAS